MARRPSFLPMARRAVDQPLSHPWRVELLMSPPLRGASVDRALLLWRVDQASSPHGASSRRPAFSHSWRVELLTSPPPRGTSSRRAVDEPSSPWCVEPSTEPSSPGASTKLPPHGASSRRPALLAPVARQAVDEPSSPWCVEPYHLAPLPFSIAPRLRLTHWHCGPQTLRTPRATAVPNDCVDDRTPAYLVCGMYASDGGRLRSYDVRVS